MSLYTTYKRRKYATGGTLPPDEQALEGVVGQTGGGASPLAQGTGMAAMLGTGIIDATSKGDPLTGRQSIGASAGKGALQGAAAGAQFGPWGAAIGAVAGGAMGFLGGKKAKKEAMIGLREENAEKARVDEQMSNARLATDPSLLTGYKSSGYFALGGTIGDPNNPGTGGSAVREVYRTQAEVDADNAMAKRFAGKYPGGVINPEDVYVAKKPGDPKVQFLTPEGKPYVGPKTKPLPTTVPSYVQASDIQSSEGKYWYTNNDGNLVDVDPSVVSLPRFRKPTTIPQGTIAMKEYGGLMTKYVKSCAMGGNMTAPLAASFMHGGKAKSLSSDSAELKGASHADGGIYIPELNTELEGGETTAGNFVFSKKLGFAQLHKPLAKAIGKIEKKPVSQGRINSMRLLNKRVSDLAETQETVKHLMQ